MYSTHKSIQSYEVAAVIPNRAEYGVSERLRNLLKATQLVSARAEFKSISFGARAQIAPIAYPSFGFVLSSKHIKGSS